MRKVALSTILLLFSSLPAVYAGAVTHGDETDRNSYNKRNYRHALYGPKAAVMTAGKAVWGEMWNHPKEWGRGAGGFGKRLASGAAGHAVGTTIEYGVGHALHEEYSYHRSEDPRFKARFKSALGNTFLVYHRGSDKRGPAVGRISGAVGGGLISRLWQPASVRTVGAGFTSAGVSLGVQLGINVAREYMPDHHRHPGQVREARDVPHDRHNRHS